MENITEFLTYDNVGMMTQMIFSGLIVMSITQVIKSHIDRIAKFITKGKVKKIKSSDITLIVSIVQVIFVMFVVNGYVLDVKSLWLVVVNSVILYLGCSKGFDKVFKEVKITKESK